MEIKYKTVHKAASTPRRMSPGAAGCDLAACIPEGDLFVDIPPRTTVKIRSGLAFAIPEGFFGAIYPRSGISAKRGLRLANCVAVIDSDYRGEVMLPLYNDSDETQRVYHGDRIAQMIIQPYEPCTMTEVKKLSDTERGKGGFGSTGR